MSEASDAWDEWAVSDLISDYFSGPSPDCEERNISSSEEWGVLKTTAITWRGWDQYAHKVLPRPYWGLEHLAVQHDDVLVTKAGPRHRVAVTCHVTTDPERLLVSGKMICLRPRKDRVVPQILAGMIAQPAAQKYIHDRTTGMAESQVNFANGALLSTRFRLPSLYDQTKIAEILDTLDAAIRGTEAVVAKLKAMKQGLLHDLLTRGIDANGDLRPPQPEAPHLYKQTPLGWLPKEWTYERFVSKVDFPQGQVSPLKAPYRDWLLIAPDHIESETGRQIASYTAAEQNAISGKYKLEPGDIVYSKIRPYLRKAIVAEQEALCSADMYPLRPRIGVDARFLLGLILGESFSRFAEAVSMRSGFPKINRSELGEYWCHWPSPHEQKLIAERLRVADEKEDLERQTLSKLSSQKAGLMDDLLTGRVPVTPLL